MGQDSRSCGTTQIDATRPLSARNAVRPDNGCVPVGYYCEEILGSTALISPFTDPLPPSCTARRLSARIKYRLLLLIIGLL